MSDLNLPQAPAPTPRVNYAAVVTAFGEAIWGPLWAAGMGRLTGIAPRTLQRVWTAARADRDYRSARGVLAALHEKLAPIVDQLEPWARHADQTPAKEP
jgi:hypothetical protein